MCIFGWDEGVEISLPTHVRCLYAYIGDRRLSGSDSAMSARSFDAEWSVQDVVSNVYSSATSIPDAGNCLKRLLVHVAGMSASDNFEGRYETLESVATDSFIVVNIQWWS